MGLAGINLEEMHAGMRRERRRISCWTTDMELAVDGALYASFTTRPVLRSRDAIAFPKRSTTNSKQVAEKTKKSDSEIPGTRRPIWARLSQNNSGTEVMGYVASGLKEGAAVVTGGRIPDSPELKEGFLSSRPSSRVSETR